MLKITESNVDDAVVIELQGRLDTATSADFDFAVEAHADKPSRVLIDLSGIAYVSSAGLRVFLMLAKKLQKVQGKLVLCGMSAGVREVFDIAGFSRILAIQPDRAAGLAALAG